MGQAGDEQSWPQATRVKQERDGQADKGGSVFQAEMKHGRRTGVCRQKLDVYVSQSLECMELVSGNQDWKGILG